MGSTNILLKDLRQGHCNLLVYITWRSYWRKKWWDNYLLFTHPCKNWENYRNYNRYLPIILVSLRNPMCFPSYPSWPCNPTNSKELTTQHFALPLPLLTEGWNRKANPRHVRSKHHSPQCESLLFSYSIGSRHMCIDFWALKKIMIKDKFLILIIYKLLDEVYDTKYFSKLYFRYGYHQITLCEEEICKTSFAHMKATLSS